MPFVVRTAKNIGDPVEIEDINQTISNETDLNTRVQSLEALNQTVIVYDGPIRNAATFTTLTGVLFFRAPIDFLVTTLEVAITTKGSLTGDLELDIKKSSSMDFSSAVSIFTTKPTVDFDTVSNYAIVANGVFNSGLSAITEGQFLRVDITGMPTGDILKLFNLTILGEV